MAAEPQPELLLREAARRGFSELEIVVSQVERFRAEISANMIKPVSAGSRTIYGLRGVIGKRVGGLSVSDLAVGVEDILRDLERIVRNSPEDPNWPGFPPRIYRGNRAETYSREFDELGPEKAVELAGLIVEEALEEGRSVGADKTYVVNAYVELARINMRVVNTNGVDVVEKCSMFSSGGGVKSIFSGVESTYHFSIGARRVEEEGLGERVRQAVSHTRLFANPSTPESGVYELVLTPRVFGEVLTYVVAPAVSGLNILEGRSPLRGRVGLNVFDERITIRDDPLLPLHYGSRSFDDEGVGVVAKTVFDKGVFKTPLTNYYASRRLNTEATGNGFRSVPGVSTTPTPTNLVVEGGSGGLEEFVRDVRRGVVVYSTIGGWMSNFVAGQVYFTVTHGLLVESGSVKPVKSFVVTGSIFDWLGGKLVAVGSDSETNFNIVSPSLYVREAMVSGG
ncbi:MAG: TldD/PmbA family protein [Thermogladius sp.]|nr:TldD/PmbA family protein [Thermogladius sp.]